MAEPTRSLEKDRPEPEGEDARKQDSGDEQDRSKDGGKEDGKDKKRTRWPLIVLGIVIVLAVIAGLVIWFLTKDQESTDDAYTDGRAIMIAPQVSGQVMTLAVDDNWFVHKGDLIIALDPRQYRASLEQAEGQVTAIQAQLANARVALDKEKVTAPADLLSAEGKLAQAQAQLIQAKAEYRRQHAVQRAATSQQNIDRADASYQQAVGQVQQAEAGVQQASLVPQNIAQAAAQIDQLTGQLRQAQGNLAQAQINIGYTKVTAPQDGWITKRNVEVGNYVQTGTPVVAIVSPQIWITANFKENQLDRMRRGQRVEITVDAYPSLDLTGHVDSLQLGSGSRFSAIPAENATGNFVKIVQRVPVKIVIDRGLDPRLPLPLGLSVEPTVLFK
jgi:membrane fusion protein (multidrug efflux system)